MVMNKGADSCYRIMDVKAVKNVCLIMGIKVLRIFPGTRIFSCDGFVLYSFV